MPKAKVQARQALVSTLLQRQSSRPAVKRRPRVVVPVVAAADDQDDDIIDDLSSDEEGKGAGAAGVGGRDAGAAAAGRETALWVDAAAPRDSGELAVHPRKYAEVVEWLRRSSKALGERQAHAQRLLLLTGPAGCGKSAAVRVACRELGMDLSEWSPSVRYEWKNAEGQVIADGNQGSKLDEFRDFMLRAPKYGSLLGGPAGKIVMVDDLSTLTIKRFVDEFHDIVRKFLAQGRFPLVLVLTEGRAGENVVDRWLPKEISAGYMTATIAFNPASVTMIVAALTRVARVHSCPQTKAQLTELAQNSRGDIRAAINALQFLNVGVVRRGAKKRTSRKAGAAVAAAAAAAGGTTNPGGVAAAGRDLGFSLFQAVGRLLYPRSDDADIAAAAAADGSKQPAAKRRKRRGTLRAMTEEEQAAGVRLPETIIEMSGIGAPMLACYVFENYPAIFGDSLDDACAVTECLSLFDATDDYLATTRQAIAGSILVRGTMQSNQHPPQQAGFNPIRGPQLIAINRDARESLGDYARRWPRESRAEMCVEAETRGGIDVGDANNNDDDDDPMEDIQDSDDEQS